MPRLIMAYSKTAESWFYIKKEYRSNFGCCYWFTGERGEGLDESHYDIVTKLHPDIDFKLEQ